MSLSLIALVSAASLDQSAVFQKFSIALSQNFSTHNLDKSQTPATAIQANQNEQQTSIALQNSTAKACYVSEAQKRTTFTHDIAGWHCSAHMVLFHFGCTFLLLAELDDDWVPETLQLQKPSVTEKSKKFSRYNRTHNDSLVEPIAPPPDFGHFKGLSVA